MAAHRVTATHLYRYIRALGTLGDSAGMVNLVRWILDAWSQHYLLEDARHHRDLGYHYILRTLSYFCELGSSSIDPDIMQSLQDRLEELRLEEGCTWLWPTESSVGYQEEVDIDLVVSAQWKMVKEIIRPVVDGVATS